jgi:hypothetical protein
MGKELVDEDVDEIAPEGVRKLSGDSTQWARELLRLAALCARPDKGVWPGLVQQQLQKIETDKRWPRVRDELGHARDYLLAELTLRRTRQEGGLVRVAEAVAAAGAGNGEGETPAPPAGVDERKAGAPDGPFEPNGFRFRGVPVRFGRAALQLWLIRALWDGANACPREAQPIQTVIDAVWGEKNDTGDGAFRQLCTDTRTKLESANCPLTIRAEQGKVWLEARQ